MGLFFLTLFFITIFYPFLLFIQTYSFHKNFFEIQSIHELCLHSLDLSDNLERNELKSYFSFC